MGLALGNANGIFDVGAGRTLTISSIISHVTSGNGFTKTGTGTLSLGGTNTYNGATIISAGTLSLTNVDALQNSSGLTLGGASAATLTFGADTTGVIIPGAITAANSGVNSTISFGRNTANAGSLSLSGGITGGAGNVIFTTPSANGTNGGQTQTIVLGAAGGYSGNTTITSGGNQFTNTIRAGVANALPATTVLSFTGVAGTGSGRTSTYDLNGNNQELAGLQNTAANDRFQRVTSGAAATLTINNSVAHTFGNFTTGADPGNAQITGAISLAKSNVGTFTLLGSQVYTGATTINAGVLQLGNGGTTGTLTATASITNDGNLTINRSDAFSQATGLGSGVAITGTGSFTQAGAGTTTLTAANTYQGATTISAGVLRLGSGGTTGSLTATASITNDGNLTINRSDAFSQATDLGAGVAITGTGSFTQAGAGTTTLTATNTYQGATNVNAGTLVINGSTSSTSLVTVAAAGTLKGSGTINGSLDVSGTLASGTSIESLAVGGNLSFLGGSNFQYELDKDAAANAAGDLTAVAGSLSLAGIVNLSFIETGVGAWELGNPLGDHTGSPAADKLTLISYNGTWNNNLFTYLGELVQDDSSVTINGQQWWFNYNDTDAGTNFTGDLGGATRFVTIAVPEPGAALLGGLGMLGLLRRRR
jgi:fibronectin-binding autotransporter adhesin